uniref:Uncharacterized protein n=1 Tax=Glossina pallidipes TaxID=7398 RepID=A0A1A9ZXB8_GLOPL
MTTAVEINDHIHCAINSPTYLKAFYTHQQNFLTSSVHAWVKNHSNLNGNSSIRYFNFNKRLFITPSLMFVCANSSIEASAKSLFNKGYLILRKDWCSRSNGFSGNSQADCSDDIGINFSSY